MAWLKGKYQNEEYCINTETIRNVTKTPYRDEREPVYKVWFSGVTAYQQIEKTDYEKLLSWLNATNRPFTDRDYLI